MGIQSVFLSDERRVTSDDGDFNIPPEGMSNQERSLIRVLRERMRRRERVSGHVAPDTEKGMSLQERSIIRVLRERMRRRERVSGHAAPDTDQRATMEKERLKEKLALRNGMRSSTKGVLNVSKTTRDVSEAKALAGRAAARSSSPKRSASPTRRVEVAVRETQARKSALAATPVEVPAPKAAAVTGAAPLPTSTPEQAKSVAPDVTCESCAAGSYTAWLPRKISAYCKLSEVVDALELVQGTEVALPNAVGAMNRLKRLQRQAGGDRKLVARLNGLLAFFGDVVLAHVDTLSGKLLSLTVNAIAESPSHRPLLRACAARVEVLAAQDDRGFDAQALSVTLNGFARARMRDERLFAALSAMACSRAASDPGQFNAQSVSVILNAFAKMRVQDARLFAMMAETTRGIPRGDFCPQAVVNILNAIARHGEHDVATVHFLSSVAQSLPPEAFLSRHLAIAVNAMAKINIRDDALLSFAASAALARPAKSFDLQAVANILNAYGKLHGRDMDQKLLRHMTHALRHTDPSLFDPTSLASSVGALVKVGYTDRGLFKQLSEIAVGLDPLLFDAQSVSTVMQSWAKADIKDVRLFNRMAGVVRQMTYMLEPQSIALVVNACAKAEHRDDALLADLSDVAQKLPPDAYMPQHVDTIVNGYARLGYKDKGLFRFMAKVTTGKGAEEFDWQAVAITMNAFAKGMTHHHSTRTVFRHFTHQIMPKMSEETMTQTSISIMLNGYAKTELREAKTVERLCEGIKRLTKQEGAFDVRNVASVMHALATLDLSDDSVVSLIVDQLLLHPVESLHAEEVAIVAWSSAVLALPDPRLVDYLLDGLEFHMPNMDRNFRRQALQFILSCELDGLLAKSTRVYLQCHGEAPGEWARRVFETLGGRGEKEDSHKPSRLQLDVSETMRDMRLEFVEEHVHASSGYSMDLLLSDQKTTIEVDGPSHYASGTRTPLGSTIMKHRHLHQLGFDLRVLPYWEWDQLDTKAEKQTYIRSLLTSTPSLNF